MTAALARAMACQLVGLTFALIAIRARAQTNLTSLKIEDLMNVDVTSASKREQKLSRVPAAIFVITNEEIRHAGAMTIPDLLRMLPGLEVAQINSSIWAISARGFKNLHQEYSGPDLTVLPALIRRSGYVRVAWRF